jgi:hypothetical protein
VLRLKVRSASAIRPCCHRSPPSKPCCPTPRPLSRSRNRTKSRSTPSVPPHRALPHDILGAW